MQSLNHKSYLLLLNQLFFDTPSKAKFCFDTWPNSDSFFENKQQIFTHFRFNEKTKARFENILNTYNPNQIEVALSKANISTLLISDNEYPESLKEISDPPILLFFQGNINCLKDPKLAVIGARNASSYGYKVAEYLVHELSNYFCIVSGLAKGIDTQAHETTLKNNGKTIAVFGCGLDIVYPYENKELCKKIIASNGLILSEFPPTTPPATHRFPIRNRIVSGLCQGVLICEASEKSGSLITANSALDQNRDVFAVPGAIFNEHSTGTNKLIQSGAKLVTSPTDILEEYEKNLNFVVKQKPSNPIDKIEKTEMLNLSPIEEKIIESLKQTPQSIDDLINSTALPIHQLLQEITLLELKGLIKQDPGKRYSV